MTNESDEVSRIKQLIDAYRRRLHHLEIQRIQLGIHTPPHIHIDIDDCQKELNVLQSRLEQFPVTPEIDITIFNKQLSTLEANIRSIDQQLRNIERRQSRRTEIYKTNVSQAFWYSAEEPERPFVPAYMGVQGSQRRQNIAWFDELLRGGLKLPETSSRPLTMVITGPPGSGKTTLVLEMCYRLAKNGIRNPRELFSLYISLDQDADRLIDNAINFNYDASAHFLLEYDVERDELMPHRGQVVVYGRDGIMDNLRRSNEIAKESRNVNIKNIILGARNDLEHRLKSTHRSGFPPDIVVIDSLNIVPGQEKDDLFETFRSISSSGSKLNIFIIDSMRQDSEYAMWEYISDFVIRLDYTTLNNYYIRTIEVVKARYQSHIWGKHQMKVYEKQDLDKSKSAQADAFLRRNHPYREEGGIFIYPSIHYYLSLYKRSANNQKIDFARTKPTLEGVLDRGLPEGRCTAFIGTRGGHKSHFGYLHLLHHIIDMPAKVEEAALIISLRDDEEMTATTLDKMIEEEFNGRISRHSLEQQNKLEILYFHPGYITPEEFFHRVFISVQRLKRNGRKLTVLFNSVDQLASRFPLCAKENIFIPGIVEFLTGEGATSIFIAVDEPGQPAEQYGLLPMADLILSFYPYEFIYSEYQEMAIGAHKIDINDEHAQTMLKDMNDKYGEKGSVEAIVLQVVRFAGGEQAGARGILELATKEDLRLYKSPGLYFTKLGPKVHPTPVMPPTQRMRKL